MVKLCIFLGNLFRFHALGIKCEGLNTAHLYSMNLVFKVTCEPVRGVVSSNVSRSIAPGCRTFQLLGTSVLGARSRAGGGRCFFSVFSVFSVVFWGWEVFFLDFCHFVGQRVDWIFMMTDSSISQRWWLLGDELLILLNGQTWSWHATNNFKHEMFWERFSILKLVQI